MSPSSSGSGPVTARQRGIVPVIRFQVPRKTAGMVEPDGGRGVVATGREAPGAVAATGFAGRSGAVAGDAATGADPVSTKTWLVSMSRAVT